MSRGKKVVQVGRGRKGGRGTHGSITKAGKVRSMTPKIVPKEKEPNPSPRVGNRKRYEKLINKYREEDGA